MTKPDDPYFPLAEDSPNTGATIREVYAGVALKGLLDSGLSMSRPREDRAELAALAVAYADDLITALNAPKTSKES